MQQHPSEQSTPSSSDNLLPKLWMLCRPRPAATLPAIFWAAKPFAGAACQTSARRGCKTRTKAWLAREIQSFYLVSSRKEARAWAYQYHCRRGNGLFITLET